MIRYRASVLIKIGSRGFIISSADQPAISPVVINNCRSAWELGAHGYDSAVVPSLGASQTSSSTGHGLDKPPPVMLVAQ